MTIIYALLDPRSFVLRYVGKTSNTLIRRLAKHLVESRHNRWRSGRWIQSLVKLGLRPVIVSLQIVPDGTDWAAAERFWISHFKATGCDLLNHTPGGEGRSGLHTEAAKAKMSAAHKGVRLSEEHKRSLSAARRGHLTPQAVRDKISAAQKGIRRGSIVFSNPEERRRKISAATKGRVITDEQRAKISRTLLGRRLVSQEIQAEILCLARGGASRREIGSRLSVDRHTVGSILSEQCHGIKGRRLNSHHLAVVIA
jgi:hypothetical protein